MPLRRPSPQTVEYMLQTDQYLRCSFIYTRTRIVEQVCGSSGCGLPEATQKTKAETTVEKDPKKEIDEGDVSNDEHIYERGFAVQIENKLTCLL